MTSKQTEAFLHDALTYAFSLQHHASVNKNDPDKEEALARSTHLITSSLMCEQQDNKKEDQTHPLDDRIDHPSHDDSSTTTTISCKESSFRFPCKARGLSSTHNNETAYFEIPFDAPHGMLVHCSHPECYGSGRSFRYCRVCECPVAKRNFLLRHSHGIINSSEQLKMEVDSKRSWSPRPSILLTTTTTTTTTPMGSSSCVVTAMDHQPPLACSSKAAAVRSDASSLRLVSVEEPDRYCSSIKSIKAEEEQESNRRHCSVKKIIKDDPPQKVITSTTSRGSSRHQQLSKDEQEWLHLLHSRPSLEEEDAMSKWMDDVLLHSEAAELKKTRSENKDETQIPPRTSPANNSATCSTTSTKQSGTTPPNLPGCTKKTTTSIEFLGGTIVRNDDTASGMLHLQDSLVVHHHVKSLSDTSLGLQSAFGDIKHFLLDDEDFSSWRSDEPEIMSCHVPTKYESSK